MGFAEAWNKNPYLDNEGIVLTILYEAPQSLVCRFSVTWLTLLGTVTWYRVIDGWKGGSNVPTEIVIFSKSQLSIVLFYDLDGPQKFPH